MYTARNKILWKMGYEDYAQYLKSPLWRKIRGRVMARHNKVCQVCWGKAWQIHHVYYSKANLTGSSLRGMMAICGKCHGMLEYLDEEKTKKRHPLEAALMTGHWKKCRVCKRAQHKDRWDKKNDQCRKCAGSQTPPSKSLTKRQRTRRHGHNKRRPGFCRRCGVKVEKAGQFSCDACLDLKRMRRLDQSQRRKGFHVKHSRGDCPRCSSKGTILRDNGIESEFMCKGCWGRLHGKAARKKRSIEKWRASKASEPFKLKEDQERLARYRAKIRAEKEDALRKWGSYVPDGVRLRLDTRKGK